MWIVRRSPSFENGIIILARNTYLEIGPLSPSFNGSFIRVVTSEGRSKLTIASSLTLLLSVQLLRLCLLNLVCSVSFLHLSWSSWDHRRLLQFSLASNKLFAAAHSAIVCFRVTTIRALASDNVIINLLLASSIDRSNLVICFFNQMSLLVSEPLLHALQSFD